MAQVSPEGPAHRKPKPKNKKANKHKGEREKEKKEWKREEKDPVAALRCANQALCSGFVYAPAYTCEAEHALCVTCVAFHAGRCPLCRAPLPRAVAFHLEERADHLLLACVYRSKGCHFRFPREELVFHQVECRYARKQCFASKCGFLGDNKELAAHMEKSHAERVTKGMEAEFTFRNIITRCDGVHHIQFLRNRLGNFWIKYMYSETESQLYGAVQYIGPKQEAEKLEYQFEMKEYDDSKFTGLKTIFTGKMPTHVKSFETIFASQDCFTVTLDFAEYFENNDLLHLTVRVKPIDFPL
ncbi:E3 ubiquitin-protein ligase sina [Gryllus bimaculatus]|nr:E3 ubiquitin-protein ligase sina [Gryllus bimaculatus]